MKISLNLDELNAGDDKSAQNTALERVILAAKAGDFEARDALFQHYMSLLTSLAKKRTNDVSEINQLIEGGKTGLLNAAHKYKPSITPEKFKLFALDFIEKGMSDTTHHGFFSRFFKK
jgi:DNA-directed RNA polymerase specialized sigma subunit